jgi:hypothetical protein
MIRHLTIVWTRLRPDGARVGDTTSYAFPADIHTLCGMGIKMKRASYARYTKLALLGTARESCSVADIACRGYGHGGGTGTGATRAARRKSAIASTALLEF